MDLLHVEKVYIGLQWSQVAVGNETGMVTNKVRKQFLADYELNLEMKILLSGKLAFPTTEIRESRMGTTNERARKLPT